MLRCRILNERSSAYVCAFCRHPALARQLEPSRRSYSDTTNSPTNGGNTSGGWGSKSSVSATGSSTIPQRPVGPVTTSGWGKPAFGGVSPRTTPPKTSTDQQSSTSSGNAEPNDGLLPHERAARQRLAAKNPIPPEPRKVSQPPNGASPGLGLGLFSRSKQGLDNASSTRKRAGGLEELGSPSNRSPSGLRANNPATNDWRHRGLDRTPLPGVERKPPSTPIPHHRHGVKQELGRPSGLGGPRGGFGQPSGLGKSNLGELPGFGKPSSLGEAAVSRTPSGLNQPADENFESWAHLSRKTQNSAAGGSADAAMTKDDFFAKFQDHMAGSQERMGQVKPTERRKQRQSLPEDSDPFEILEVPEEQQTSERKTRAFDESYEIDRDSRKRDRGGNRRGEVSGRGKKPTAQQRWEDKNGEWHGQDAVQIAEERRRKAEERAQRKAAAAAIQTIFLPEFINIANLSQALKIKTHEFMRALEEMGFEDITEDSIMTGETASLVAMEYGFDATVDTGGARDLRPRPPPEDTSILPQRPPVVTIMGHVDHGKTTLLDYLRKSSVAAQEHGGITQHIGAFMVKMSSGKLITFLDTPGHAAFLTMRQRGANVTDIVVLVVAADDSVKPQTVEALKHAKAANVPIIVAINKIDKEDARPDQVKADLSRHGVEIEDYGGDVQVVCVSGKTGKGMDELEENIVALAEIQDVRAEDDGLAEAWVLEASVKTYGKSANMLIKRGTLRPGDHIVAGTTWARIRMLRNEAGLELEEAPPGTPVEVLGWRDQLPAAGDEVLQAPDEDRARTAVDYREEMREREAASKQLVEQELREREARAAAAVAEAMAEAEANEEAQPAAAATKIVNFLVRGDVVGSVEAVCATINEIGNNEVRPRILWSSAGQVSESDVDNAAASNSVIINFSSPIPGHIKRLAEDKGVRIVDHAVIYHLADEVKRVMSENLADKVSSKVTGEAEILQIFPINIKGRLYKNIAGCRVRNGLVTRSTMVRIIRKGENIFDGKIETLKHGKKDVTEIRKGSECGISFEDFTDFQVGDQIQTYEEVREKRSL